MKKHRLIIKILDLRAQIYQARKVEPAINLKSEYRRLNRKTLTELKRMRRRFSDLCIITYYQDCEFTPEHIAEVMGIPVAEVWDVTDMCDSAERDAEMEGE